MYNYIATAQKHSTAYLLQQVDITHFIYTVSTTKHQDNKILL